MPGVQDKDILLCKELKDQTDNVMGYAQLRPDLTECVAVEVCRRFR